MIQTIQDVNDCVPLYLPHSLYLKPLAKFNISVALPGTITGKTISNFDVMEKMRQMILPDRFSLLKVSKSTVGFIRFEGELEDRGKLKAVLSRLDGRPLRLAGFDESVKVRASEAKDDFPTRHDWDSFFRDARNMDEMKAGERPDTIHFSNLPIKWFCPRHAENDDNAKPSENIFKRIFEKFGEVRAVDIPICDPYRSQMKAHMSGMKKFSFDQEMYFEGYVQFSEYVGFVKAMDEFRGMKLVRKEGERNLAVTIAVDFDQTKHLSDASVKKRQVVRDRLIAVDREKEEQEKKRLAEEEARKELERKQKEEKRQAEIELQLQREQRRKEKHLQKLRQKESDEISQKIRLEEKKLLEAQRKLESIRLLDALFERMKMKHSLEKGKQKSLISSDGEGNDNVSVSSTQDRKKKANKLKATQEKELERMRVRLKQAKDGSVLKKVLSSGLGVKVERSRSPSINTISSDDAILSDTPQTKVKKKRKSRASSKKSGDSDVSSSEESSNEEEEPLSGEEKIKRENRDGPQAQQHPSAPYPSAQGMPYDRSAMGYGPPMHPAAAYPPTAMYPGMDWTTGMSYPYAYDPFYAQYYASSMAYRGPFRTATRGPPRYPRGGPGGVSRGRGSGYRGRGGYDYYRGGRGGDDYDGYDRSGSRSYSRSRSRSRHRRRSSRSRSRRSRSRSSRSRSRSRSRRSRTHRSRSSSRTTSRSRSRSRSRKSKSEHRSRSRSKSRSRSHSHHRSKRTRSRSRSRSDERSKKPAVQLSKPTSKNLVSTIRGSTRSRSHSRSRSRSKSHSRSRSNYKHRSSRRHRSPRPRRADSAEPKVPNEPDQQEEEPFIPGPIGPRSPPELPPPPEPPFIPEHNNGGAVIGNVRDEDEEPAVVSESFKKHRIIVRTDTLGSKSTKEIEEEVRERLLRQQMERELQVRKEREKKKRRAKEAEDHKEEDDDDDEEEDDDDDDDEDDDDEDDEEDSDEDDEERQNDRRKVPERRMRNHTKPEPSSHGNGHKRREIRPPTTPPSPVHRRREGKSPDQRESSRRETQQRSGRFNGEPRKPRTPSSSESQEDSSGSSSGSSSEAENPRRARPASHTRPKSPDSPDRRHRRKPDGTDGLDRRRPHETSAARPDDGGLEEKRARLASRQASAVGITRGRSQETRRSIDEGRVPRSPVGKGRLAPRQRSRSREHHRKSSHSRADGRRNEDGIGGDESMRRRDVAVSSRHGHRGSRRS